MVNMHGLFQSIIIVNAFQSILDSLEKIQTKYGLAKAVNFIKVFQKLVKRQWHDDNDVEFQYIDMYIYI